MRSIKLDANNEKHETILIEHDALNWMQSTYDAVVIHANIGRVLKIISTINKGTAV